MKFTIIIPAYNSSSFINIPLDSLEKQTYKDNFQVLIIDDGSTDNLKEVISPYLLRNKFGKLIQKKNGNWGSVINYVKCKNLINGEYVTILDSDDYFKPSTLQKVSKFNDEIIITKIAKKIKNKEKDMPVFFKRKTRKINIANAFTPVSTPHGKFYKKELFEKMIDLKEGVSYQDTVLYNDLVSKSKSIQYISESLAVGGMDREGNSTTQEGDESRAKLGLETCLRIVTLPYVHDEANSGALMYLGELNRNYKGKAPFKISIDTTKAKFKGLPYGLRGLAKIYFLIKTKKFRK